MFGELSPLSPENTTGNRTVSVIYNMVFKMYNEVSKSYEYFYYKKGLETDMCKCAVIALNRL